MMPKPDDIPQDVWETGQDAAAMYVEWLVPVPTEYDQSEHVLAVSFARAILAERERCAKVAEGFGRNRDWVPGSLYDTLRREVATAIRKGGEA